MALGSAILRLSDKADIRPRNHDRENGVLVVLLAVYFC